MPADLEAERGWRILEMEGLFDLPLIGILSGAVNVLKANGSSLFVVSTFDTDYILVKIQKPTAAIEALAADGCTPGL